MKKTEAQAETVRRWRELPLMERQTLEQATAFAQSLHGTIEFETLGNKRKILEAWIVKELPPSAVKFRVEAKPSAARR
ncbi:MAG TPA: hypothetical protein VFE52_08990 [Devosia sp.]|jgi:hypothetical protein|nr:hypothetical protein [Devosia sp.]